MSSSVITQRAMPPLRRKLLWWLPTVLWLCLQALFSTDMFSSEHTGSILWSIVRAIYPGITPDQFEMLHFLVRKAAHVSTYGILSVFGFFSWRATLPSNQKWTLRWSVLAVLLAFVAGSLDEFHQTFVPSRTASPRDVLIDTVGAICFQAVLAMILRRRTKVLAESTSGLRV